MRFMDALREDMAVFGSAMIQEDADDIPRAWRRKIRCGDFWREKPKEEEEDELLGPGTKD